MSEQKENNEWDNRELGALWVNTKKGSGEKYLTGHINNEKIIIFKNKFKEENPKAPDFRIYKQKDLDGSTAPPAAPASDEEEVDLI